MKRVHSLFTKIVGLLIVFLVIIPAAFAQRPEIKEISKVKGSMDDIVLLKGSFFGTDATKLVVFFGATPATILQAADQLLEVKVPAGTTYQDISVTRFSGVTGLTGYYRQPFFLSFGGAPGIDPAKFGLQSDYPAGVPVAQGLYDLCMCDFDGDSKPDIAAARDNNSFLLVLSNASTPGSINLGGTFNISLGTRSLQVKCGDLNGDGKPDIVATEKGTGDNVFFLRNTSIGPGSISFAKTQIPLTGKTPNRIEIADLDLDGKPEVILTSQATNSVIVLVNQTPNITTLSFSSTPITIPLPDWKSTDGLAVEDLNGDFLPEIVTNQFITNTDLYVIQNNSAPGAVTMSPAITLPVGNTVKNLKIGDLDGDGKSDIAFTQLSPSSNLGVFLNTSTSGTLSFGGLKTFATDTNPWGIDFGDLDGDGKADIVTPSITKKTLTILNNTSTPGNLSFTTLVKATDYINRHVVIGDVDGDGKPDIAFTSIDDNNLNIPASKVSIFRNSACMIPEVNPKGPLNVCSGFPLTLTSTNGGATTFEWLNATTSTTTPGTYQFSPTATGDYSVTATSEGGSCKTTSNVVKVTISASAVAGNPDPQSNGPVCIGNTMNLVVNNDLGAGFTYEWTGPNNYTGSGVNPAPVTNFQLTNAGIYILNTKAASGCVARIDPIIVKAVDIPDFKVAYTGSSLVCLPGAKTLSVYPAVSVPTDFTIQWYEQTLGLLPGATSSTLSKNVSGEYYYKATSSNPSCPVAQSESAIITVVAPPVTDFVLPASACKGEEVSFTDQSTTDPAAAVIYAWDFGDATTSSDKNPKHIFNTATGFTVKLTVAYTGNACPVSASKPITITAAPDVFITNAENTFDVCPESSLVLGLNDTFTSYLWSTGETSPTITVKDPGDYNVAVVATNGCKLKAEQTIGGLPSPTVTATATPEEIDEGASAQLTAEGLLDFSWTPTETLSDPSISNPIATPLSSTTYTVTGKGGNGCVGSTTVQLKVRGEAIVNKLLPGNFFSPNGDAVGAFWMVGKIDEYPQCEVTIYDDKGVKVYNSKPYQNNWDGTFNGKRLPDGVYYYIIRCEGEESMPRSGSITLLR
ncbi:gliding motility-associated C-terminal domain-containing protein [Chryseolinea serpens]|uniref:Gliding motility-associated C-terminal domain-containing protein n=1 Tax=Chryseolinea serpens TaxID=947013 RepID=A0A1M5VIX6_9BACT|nr:FG-GAP-like repeat-containing protein [Chryseolinea serpens]SHH75138.1 gliding motility-associated C-terminal domain-containing protein [Chryseolinea serpens]